MCCVPRGSAADGSRLTAAAGEARGGANATVAAQPGAGAVGAVGGLSAAAGGTGGVTGAAPPPARRFKILLKENYLVTSGRKVCDT